MPDPTPTPAPDPSSPAPAFTEEQLKAALTAFKKRLKLTKLDQESRLGGHRPTSAGRASDIVAIQPPNQFKPEVWQELARRNLIRNTGSGFYSLP